MHLLHMTTQILFWWLFQCPKAILLERKKTFSLAFCLCVIKKDKRLFIEWPSTYKLSLTLSARIYLICWQSTLWQLTFQKVLKRKFSRFTFVSIWAVFEREKWARKLNSVRQSKGAFLGWNFDDIFAEILEKRKEMIMWTVLLTGENWANHREPKEPSEREKFSFFYWTSFAKTPIFILLKESTKKTYAKIMQTKMESCSCHKTKKKKKKLIRLRRRSIIFLSSPLSTLRGVWYYNFHKKKTAF